MTAAASKLGAIDISALTKRKKTAGSKSIRRNPQVRLQEIVLTGSFHPPAHRVESDRDAVVVGSDDNARHDIHRT